MGENMANDKLGGLMRNLRKHCGFSIAARPAVPSEIRGCSTSSCCFKEAQVCRTTVRRAVARSIGVQPPCFNEAMSGC